MSGNFSRTIRSVRVAGRLESGAFIVGAIALALGWALWFGLSHVTVYAMSETARLEVEHAAVPVHADAAGLVVGSRLSVGDEVKAGDVLVELDAEADRRLLAEETTSPSVSKSARAQHGSA